MVSEIESAGPVSREGTPGRRGSTLVPGCGIVRDNLLVAASNGAYRASLVPRGDSVTGSWVVFAGVKSNRTLSVSRSFWRESRGYSSRSTPLRLN